MTKIDGECQLYGEKVIRKETDGFPELSIASCHKGVKRFVVNMIDTPGYGQKEDAAAWRSTLRGEIERRMILRHETESEVETRLFGEHQRLQRELKKIRDERVHVVLYFFDGHHCKQQDLEACIELQELTNVMPILAKGDQFVQLEMSEVKKTLIRNANAHGVQFFDVRGALSDMEDKHLK